MNLVLSIVRNRNFVVNFCIGELICFIDLRSLDLSHNQLTQLPESVSDLINLEEIYGNSNRLAVFPSFTQCARLKVDSKFYSEKIPE